jgi:hypothetical protein
MANIRKGDGSHALIFAKRNYRTKLLGMNRESYFWRQFEFFDAPLSNLKGDLIYGLKLAFLCVK